ncbi:MAG TPA: HAMP domain-containing sensor histidine kinase, partial [Solirubrobacteraceae bacterium]|nr:HAMP domain-containing sensor histidine kinase [Solirubrobacteraceae bacterium]
MLVLAIVALELPLAASVADRVDSEVRSQARDQARVVAALAADSLSAADARDLERVVETSAENVRGRVIVVDRERRLLADSQGTPRGRSYLGRPEIEAALAGRPDQRERRSQTLGERLLATAVPVVRDGRPVGAVRVTQSVAAVDRAVRRAWAGLALIGVLVLGVGLLAGSFVAAQIARPIRRLDRAARRVGDGDLDVEAAIEGSAEQRSLAQSFNEMTARLRRLVNSQREFVADASHQLRTPLAGLRLRIEAARADIDDDDARAELDGALAEVDRFAQLVGELLELSRAGERDLDGERVALADLVARAGRRWEGAAAQRGQRLVLNARNGGAAWISPADGDRILDALIENALHYSPPGTAVTIDAGDGGLEVRDEGHGLQPGEAPMVFQRFYRGSAARSGPTGTGLGLPIARELARRWGGDVTL